MGICESSKKNQKSICRINSNGEKGIGIFCKFPLPPTNDNSYVLIAHSKFIGSKEIFDQKKITFSLDDEDDQKTLLIDDSRKVYINEEKYKITIIEIRDEDNIGKDYFSNVELDDISDENYFKQKLGIFNPDNKNEGIVGQIQNIDPTGYKFDYSCQTSNFIEGTPIINLVTHKFIAINNSYDDKNKISIGTFLKMPISEFIVMKKIPQFQAKLNNELILYYSIPPINDLKLFGEDFVIKNKNKCKLLILDADHVEHEIELCAYINPDELFLQNNIIIIFLVQTDYFTDLSFMFHKCENLIMVSGFSNIATEYVTNMKGMFEYCTKLKKLDDI